MTGDADDDKTKEKDDDKAGGNGNGGGGGDVYLFEGPARWVEAETEVRSTLKWLLSGLGAAATLLFGSGPLLTGFEYETSWSPEWRAAVALVLVAVGIGGVVYVARRVLDALSPVELTVASLNGPGSAWRARVALAPTLWLPEGVVDLDAFQRELRDLATQAKRRRLGVAHLEAELAEGGTNAHLAEVTERLGNLRELADVTDVNLATFQRARDLLLAQAAHAAAAKQARFGTDVGGAVVAVVVCAAAYVFVVAGKEAEPAKPSAAFPAVLVDVDAGFVTGAGLTDCAGTVDLGGEGERSGIPVIVTAQTDEAITFDVIAVDGCPAITATLPAASATVVRAKPLTVTVPKSTDTGTSESDDTAPEKEAPTSSG